MLIRLVLAGPATACLLVDLERRDYLLLPAASSNATFITQTDDTGSVSHSGIKAVQPTGHPGESKLGAAGQDQEV